MHVVFIEPAFPRNQQEFARALRDAGARVTGIGELPLQALPQPLQHWLYKYYQVRSVCDVEAVFQTVKAIQRREQVDLIEATVEAHQMPTAKVREACGITGTSLETTYLCRDKPSMKEALRQAGIACAQSTAAGSAAEVRAFVDRVGLPVIIKPRDAAGAAGTSKVTNAAELEVALAGCGFQHGASVAVEEFIEGHEGFYDTITVGGQVMHDFVSHYYPGVLEAMRTRWISPQFIATNRVDAPSYAEVKEMGRRVIEALKIGTSATHMEWFYGPKGLKFSEIGCRPPGVGAWDLYCASNEADIYKEWAMALVWGRSSQRMTRRFAAGLINLRPDRDGRVAGYEGLDAIHHRFGEWILDEHIPPPGSPTQPVSAGYMANAWMRLRHPDYDHLRWMLSVVGETVRMRAS
jgi:hypothetical protein